VTRTLRLVVAFPLFLLLAAGECAPPKSQGVPNSELTIPDVPPAGKDVKKGPLGGPPVRP
jgi:hypothetical protein